VCILIAPDSVMNYYSLQSIKLFLTESLFQNCPNNPQFRKIFPREKLSKQKLRRDIGKDDIVAERKATKMTTILDTNQLNQMHDDLPESGYETGCQWRDYYYIIIFNK